MSGRRKKIVSSHACAQFSRLPRKKTRPPNESKQVEKGTSRILTKGQQERWRIFDEATNTYYVPACLYVIVYVFRKIDDHHGNACGCQDEVFDRGMTGGWVDGCLGM